jgi:hypothetical protein
VASNIERCYFRDIEQEAVRLASKKAFDVDDFNTFDDVSYLLICD